MDTKLLLLGAIGGLLPDLIRIMRDPNSYKEYFGVKIISVVIQVGLGIFAVWLLAEYLNITSIPEKIIATSIGYTGPELLTRTFSAVSILLEKKPDDSGLEGFESRQPKKERGLMDWWAV